MKRTANIWLGLAWIGVACAGVFGLILPSVRQQMRLEQEIAALEEELDSPSEAPQILTQLEENLELLREHSRGRATPIPDDSDIAGLMGQLSIALEESGLSQRDITTQDPRELEEAFALSLSIRVEGRFPQVYEAVRRIEALPRLVRVGRLRIEAIGERRTGPSRDGQVRADLLIEAFYAPKGSEVVDHLAGVEVR